MTQQIFNDTKRRTVCLRQLSFLFTSSIRSFVMHCNGGMNPLFSCLTPIAKLTDLNIN